MNAPALRPGADGDIDGGEGLVLRRWDERALVRMAAWGEHGFPYHSFDMGHLRDPARRAAMLARIASERQHLHFAAWEGDEAVGRVSVNTLDPAGLYIWGVHVPPEHEGRGVCARMLRALIAHLAPTAGAKQFVLAANSFSARALHVYERAGFRVTETRWQYDADLARALPTATAEKRAPLDGHVRFASGRWEVRTFIMRRPAQP